MQPYSNPTRRNMEDDLSIFEKGRRPQIFQIEDALNFCNILSFEEKDLQI